MRRGHTLAEIVVVVLIVGILACVAVPRLQYGAVRGAEADAIAHQLVTDLRRVRSQALLNAGQNTSGFALVMTGASSYNGYEIVDLKDSTVVIRHNIPAGVCCVGGRRFEFGPLGSLKDGSDTQLEVSAGGKAFTITIISATGMVKCVGGS